MNKNHLLLFLGGYTLLFILLFNGYRYVLDPDATGYLSVAEQLAKGHVHDSINGIWSPLNSWILAPFLYFGFDGILAEKYLNGLYGLLTLAAFFYFIKKMRIAIFTELAIMFSAVLLVLYFVFSRIFGDLLQVLFLLLYLNIICSENFSKNYRSILLAAIIGGIGFYAKAYTFYFVLLHLPLAIYLSEKQFSKKIFRKVLIKKIASAISVLFFIAAFWVFTLQSKYGHFIIGEKQITGTLSPQYNQLRVLIYPPPYKDSYSVFDDISFFHLKPITPFTNTKLFVVQSKLAAYNFLNWIVCINEFSFAGILIILMSCFFFLLKRNEYTHRINLLLSFIIVWSSGFLLFHVETRFVWILALCLLALAGMLLTYLWNNYKGRYNYLVSLIIIGSFCILPLMQLKNLYRAGKDNFEIADAFRRNGIQGNILTSNQSDGEFSKSIIINYLSGCRHYGPFVRDYTTEEIIDAVNTYHINYFIAYYSTPLQKQLLQTSDLALHAATIYKDIYPGVIVFSFIK